MRQISTGLCSFGMSGKVFHAPFVHVHPGFDLYGVWERSTKTAADLYPKIKSFDRFEDMLTDEQVELIIVNTPNNTHFDYARHALQAGKHVVVEKPFVLHSAEGLKLQQLAQKQQKVLTVYHNRFWDSDSQLVRQVVRENWLGDLVEVEFHYDRYKEMLSAKAHKEAAGWGNGTLFDLGSHLIYQALELFGRPTAVFADIANLHPKSQVTDYFELLLFYGQMRVRLKSTYLAREATPAFVLHGTKGSFIKQRADVQENDLIAGKMPGGSDWGIEPESGKGLLHNENGIQSLQAPQGNYGGFFDQLQEAIEGTGSAPVNPLDAIEVIKIIEAAYKSYDERKIIDY